MMFGKHTAWGIKWTGLAAVPRCSARLALYRKLRDILLTPGNYAEVSGPVARCLLRMPDCPVVRDPDTVRAVLNKPLTWKTGPWYERSIHGRMRAKVLVGEVLKRAA